MPQRQSNTSIVLVASIVGSGAVFLEGSVTNVALPDMARSLGLGIAGVQWVVNGYLLTLSSLMLLGGALGDRYVRAHVMALGLAGFAVASLGCALAPGEIVLVASRVVQGIAGALVVPNSLALLEESFSGDARGTAIGQWAAWSAVSTSIGPLAGGWLVDALSWRWVFLVVVPVAAAAAYITWRAGASPRRVSSAKATNAPLDYLGALLVTAGLAALVGALTLAPRAGFGDAWVVGGLTGGVALLAAFTVVERRANSPLFPSALLQSAQFVGANVFTLFVYAALSGVMFLLMLQLQTAMHWSAIEAGSSLLPVNVLMLVLSPRVGRLAQRMGARAPMTIGAAVAGLGLLLFARVHPGASYVTGVLPAVIVFGLGLSTLVAPLTGAVLGAVDESLAGSASAVNNAVARVAGLLATAALPLAAGIGQQGDLRGDEVDAGFGRAMLISAVLCFTGAAIAWLTIKTETRTRGHAHPHLQHACVGTRVAKE